MHLGYVVKRYPRYSETFIVREILAHEAAGMAVDIFSLRPPNDTHFQNALSQVRAPVTYLHAEGISGTDFWDAIEQAATYWPELWKRLSIAQGEDGKAVYQGVLLAHEVAVRGITHLHAPFAHIGATVARMAARFADISFSFTARAKDIFPDDVRKDDLLKKLNDASAVITISDYHLQYLRSIYGKATEKVCRIYNGLDLDEFAFTSTSECSNKILSVGRLVEKKGFSDLIEACAILAAKGKSFLCNIIGEGELETALQNQIQQVGLQSKVRLLGPRPESDVKQFMKEANVFVLPCVIASDNDRDGLPNVIFETMALGTPCISTDVAGIPEVVRHERTGLIVPQHDPAALAEAIDRLQSNPELRLALARNARALIKPEFDIRINAARRRQLFECSTREQKTIQRVS